MRKKILIVEDEVRQAKLWMAKLEEEGYTVDLAGDGKEACTKMINEDYHLVLTDMRMPRMDGLELLDWVRERDRNLPVIMITAYADVDSAVRAMKRGARDYVRKPIDLEELTQIVEKTFKMKRLEEENIYLKKELSRKAGKLIVGKSASFSHVMELIRKVAKSKATVLICGETGTGKELVARTIHYTSLRRDAPLVVVNCVALPENLLESELFGHLKGAFTGAYEDKKGKFQVADSGTLFLDEVGGIPLNLQPKLLRVIENQEFEPVGGTKTIQCDVRIIAATNVDLKKAVEKGVFREDLYYRLNVFPIYLPPLRDRREDIPLLVNHFIDMCNSELGKRVKDIEKQTLDILKSYHWPGNVRELENVIERAMVLCEKDILTAELFLSLDRRSVEADTPPSSVYEGKDIFHHGEKNYAVLKNRLIAAFDRNFITELLRETRGNIAMAAKLSGMDRKNLYHKIRKLNIDSHTFKKGV
ncbi:MAG TPA: sigma-54-dependent Fis family transcriptional regulator [Candidatus Omnitrophica bacterium]|nr:sigma-54-dependent Fis family transcriptional regulator [Candidatus Omnitrophota bacterium]